MRARAGGETLLLPVGEKINNPKRLCGCFYFGEYLEEDVEYSRFSS